MKTIEVKVQDDLVALYGLEAVKNLLEEELAYQRFRLLENKIQRAMSESGIDWEKEFEQKREEAFEEYQRRRAGNSVDQTTTDYIDMELRQKKSHKFSLLESCLKGISRGSTKSPSSNAPNSEK